MCGPRQKQIGAINLRRRSESIFPLLLPLALTSPYFILRLRHRYITRSLPARLPTLVARGDASFLLLILHFNASSRMDGIDPPSLGLSFSFPFVQSSQS